MARKSVIYRQIKREVIVQKKGDNRKAIRKKMRDANLTFEEKMELSFQLQRMSRNSSYVRLCSRCSITGRPRGVYRSFGICRNKLREKAMRGEIPGLTKSSW